MDSPQFNLTPLGQIVWEDRYALKDEAGNLVEKNILDTFRRVAKAVASKEKDPKKWEKKFFDIMANRLFCPAGRILAHSGTHYSQLLNCFVLPFKDDSLESIMETARNTAIVQKFGGGTGFSYSTLRPSGSYIKGVNGRSCGVLGFIDMMSVISGVIEQGGSRRGANLGLLDISHPDVWDFVSYKTDHNWDRMLDFMDVRDEERWAAFKFENLYKLQMYNISIGVNDSFFEALKKDAVWPLMWKDKEWELYKVLFRRHNKKTGTYSDRNFEVTADCNETAIWKIKKKVPYPTSADIFEVISRRKIKASELWDRICYNAWADGCPGIINMSTARRMHNLEYAHPIEATNPCGEQPLPAYDSCNLGSLILPSFFKLKDGTVDYDLLKDTVSTAIRFLDNVLDNCEYPIPEIKKMSSRGRRIGLGTMGIHDLLINMKFGYDAEDGRTMTEKILVFIRDEAYRTSIDLAKEKGAFPDFKKEKFMESGFVKTLPEDIKKSLEENGIRSSTLLSQAPTGTIGTLYNTSTGCEPWFAFAFLRNTRLGSYEDGCPAFIKWRTENPEKEKPVYFKTAQEITPDDHIKMMVLFSRYVDSAVSKTINLPNLASVEDVKKAFVTAMENGVKGMTVFRDGSKEGVLINKDKKKDESRKPPEEADVDEKIEKMYDTFDQNAERRVDPKERGNRAVGATYRVHMQGHNLYVTANRNRIGDLVELFTTVGESKSPNVLHHTSGVEDSWAEGLGKIISLALRAGVKPASIIRNLKNIPSDKPVFSTVGDNEASELISSPPHAIARVMEEEMKYTYPKQERCEDISSKKGNCEKCGSPNIKWKSSTCYDCLDCGTTGCGGG